MVLAPTGNKGTARRAGAEGWLITTMATKLLFSHIGIVATLFRLERSRGAEDVGRGMAEMAVCLTRSGDESLRRSMETWLKQVLLPTRFPGVQLPEVSDLEEIQAMLAERALEWTREWKEEGRQEGVRSVLLSLIEQRFGTVPPEVRQRVESLLDVDELTRLATRVHLVSSIEELGLG